ncbi:MAG: phytoene/squalene synthase family protein [Anaerolineales bacterium]
MMEANWEERLLSLANQTDLGAPAPLVKLQSDQDNLRIAYQHAAKITANYSKSFFFASAFLPPPKRQAIRALYAFCRTVDDIVDVPEHQRDPAQALEFWRQLVQSPPLKLDDLVALAWVDTLHRYAIPRQYALQLIDGVAYDMERHRYQTFDELATYCYSVASTVGLMSMSIIGYANQAAIQYAIKLGVALQLTNILRDVGEDYRNGRIYLPLSELGSFGLDEDDLSRGIVTERWRQFMRFQILRARQLYAEALPGIRLLSADGRLAVAVALNVYRAVLDKIEANDYDVFQRRANLSLFEKIRRLPRIWWQSALTDHRPD